MYTIQCAQFHIPNAFYISKNYIIYEIKGIRYYGSPKPQSEKQL